MALVTETFEGVGVGSRLAYLEHLHRADARRLPLQHWDSAGHRHRPRRMTYNPRSTRATIALGILSTLSADIRRAALT